jgi:hypothetical protein
VKCKEILNQDFDSPPKTRVQTKPGYQELKQNQDAEKFFFLKQNETRKSKILESIT